jgi:hypothetical protein
VTKFGRVLRTGLSSLRDRAAARLAALRFNPSRFVVRHFGLLSAAVGVAIASAFYLAGGFHSIGMVLACVVALGVGDAWDEETK